MTQHGEPRPGPLPDEVGSSSAGRVPRVGHITFLNCLPLYWGLERTGALDLVDLVPDTPDRLSDALVAGELDAGPISLVEYLRHSDELVLLPDLAVGSDGPVLSVNLVSSRPLSELDGRPVALGSTSRTSVLLARLLLEERLGVRPQWFAHEPDLAAMLERADAAVLIGDVALRAALTEGGDHGLDVHDLGAAWREWTGLPMVFAVWAVRRDWLERDPAGVRAVHAAFLASRDLALESADEVAEQAAAANPFTKADFLLYYRSLDFRLGARQQAGMREFAARVAPLAGTPAEPVITVLAMDQNAASADPHPL